MDRVVYCFLLSTFKSGSDPKLTFPEDHLECRVVLYPCYTKSDQTLEAKLCHMEQSRRRKDATGRKGKLRQATATTRKRSLS